MSACQMLKLYIYCHLIVKHLLFKERRKQVIITAYCVREDLKERAATYLIEWTTDVSFITVFIPASYLFIVHPVNF